MSIYFRRKMRYGEFFIFTVLFAYSKPNIRPKIMIIHFFFLKNNMQINPNIPFRICFLMAHALELEKSVSDASSAIRGPRRPIFSRRRFYRNNSWRLKISWEGWNIMWMFHIFLKMSKFLKNISFWIVRILGRIFGF